MMQRLESWGTDRWKLTLENSSSRVPLERVYNEDQSKKAVYNQKLFVGTVNKLFRRQTLGLPCRQVSRPARQPVCVTCHMYHCNTTKLRTSARSSSSSSRPRSLAFYLWFASWSKCLHHVRRWSYSFGQLVWTRWFSVCPPAGDTTTTWLRV